MNHNIESLNRRLAESLGSRASRGRYAWRHTSELFFFRRLDSGEFARRSYAAISGSAWVLCELRLPTGEHPYPRQVDYFPYLETALPHGMEPTQEITQGYIRSIYAQMEQAEAAAKAQAAGRMDAATEQSWTEAQKSQDRTEQEFYDKVADWEPRSWALGEPHDPGDNDGPIAYQVGGFRDDPKPAQTGV